MKELQLVQQVQLDIGGLGYFDRNSPPIQIPEKTACHCQAALRGLRRISLQFQMFFELAEPELVRESFGFQVCTSWVTAQGGTLPIRIMRSK
jgi:hypothetical protein